MRAVLVLALRARLTLGRLGGDERAMERKQPMDVASEPVDLNDDASYMDTGVLHAERICTECGNDLATKGHNLCTECLEKTT